MSKNKDLICPFCEHGLSRITDTQDNYIAYYCNNIKICNSGFDFSCDLDMTADSMDYSVTLSKNYLNGAYVYAVAFANSNQTSFEALAKTSNPLSPITTSFTLKKYLDLFDQKQLQEFKSICNKILNNYIYY